MHITVFGIHPDDVELGCGGTVARCAAQGHRVQLVDLTSGESSTNGTVEERTDEATRASKELGCVGRVSLGLPDGGLQSEDVDQERAVVAAIRRFRPALVLIPTPDDPHPDHASGGRLIERALYRASIAGYRTEAERGGAWRPGAVLVYSGRREVFPRVLVDISDYADAKMRAVRAHQTQFGATDVSRDTPLNRSGFLDAVVARDIALGQKIGVARAEAFDTSGPVSPDDLATLVAGAGETDGNS